MPDEQPFWNIPAPPELDKRVEKAVADGKYASKAELIRDAVRRLLNETEER